MKLRILWIVAILYAFCLSLSAQTGSKDSITTMPEMPDSKRRPLRELAHDIRHVVKKGGKELTRKAKELNAIDSTWISPNLYNFTFMVEQSTWYERYRIGSTGENDIQSIRFAPNFNPKIGFYFGWRWIFLGFTFDLNELLGKNNENSPKKEYVFNLYSSKFGVDLYYRETGNNFKIAGYRNFDIENNYEGQKFNGFRSNIYGLNAYWIFNHKHFSYPAAYSQSTNQRKSCGSFMGGFSYSQHNIKFDYHQLPEEMVEHLSPNLKFHKIKYNDYNLSFGYGYNWVFARNCLLNVSLLPAIAYKKAKIDDMSTNDSQDWKAWVKDINFDLISRAGITWNNTRYYIGASMVLHTYDYRKNNFAMTNSFGVARVYAGFNFWKKKPKKKLKH